MRNWNYYLSKILLVAWALALQAPLVYGQDADELHYRLRGNDPFLKLTLDNHAGLSDDTYIQQADGATFGVDADFDAIKLLSGDISIYTEFNPDKFVINGVPYAQDDIIIPLAVIADRSGNHTITVTGINQFDKSVLIYLEDQETGAVQNLRSNNRYTFQLNTNNSPDRFLVRFTPPLEVNAISATCTGHDGEILLEQGGSARWDYLITDAFGSQMAAANDFNGSAVIGNLPAGNYTIELSNSQGYILSKYVDVIGANAVDASFTMSSSMVVVDELVTFSGAAIGHSNFRWDLGDGTTNEVDKHPVHQYEQPGIYGVTLSVYNDVCADKIKETIVVTSDEATSVAITDDGQEVKVYSYGTMATVLFNKMPAGKAVIEVYNNLGQQVITPLEVNTADGRSDISLTGQANGLYYINILLGDRAITEEVMIVGGK